MTQYQAVRDLMGRAALPEGNWCLSGSAALILQGIDLGRPINDLDIFCSTAYWFRLIGQRQPLNGSRYQVVPPPEEDHAAWCDEPVLIGDVDGIPITLFFSHDRVHGVATVNVGQWLHMAVDVDGIMCAPTQLIIDYKINSGRAKDAVDLEYIRRRLPQL